MTKNDNSEQVWISLNKFELRLIIVGIHHAMASRQIRRLKIFSPVKYGEKYLCSNRGFLSLTKPVHWAIEVQWLSEGECFLLISGL